MSDEIHILLAPDSFKGSIRAVDACRQLKKGLQRAGFPFRITELPMSDGGEGAVQALVEATHGSYQRAEVYDPLMRPIEAEYGLIDNEQTAVIEMAAASGLELLDKSEYNPMITTTYGTGELIMDALNRGCRKFIIAIGGSATNDGGTGMLESLGVRLLGPDSAQITARGGGALPRITAVDFSGLDQRLEESSFQVACDVTNPLVGPLGATYVYSPQKGARSLDLDRLEAGMKNWGRILEETIGRNILHEPGAGAAGGLGAGLLALPHVELKSGFDIITHATGLESRVAQADVIITGEGRVDDQTLYGKVVSGIGTLAERYDTPVICLAGTLGDGYHSLLDRGITAIFSIVDAPMTLEEAIEKTPRLLEDSAWNLGRLMHAVTQKKGPK